MKERKYFDMFLIITISSFSVALNENHAYTIIVGEPETAPLSISLLNIHLAILRNKTKVLDIIHTDQKCFIKINVD